MFDDLLPDSDWSFKHLRQKDTNYITHCYHRYPAKFIPQLASKLIRENSAFGNTVLDPFMGSGTTLVESKLLGRPCVGLDINPTAYLIAKAKTTVIEPNHLRSTIEKVVQAIKEKVPDNYVSMQNYPERLTYWFSQDTISKLEAIYNIISSLDEDTRPFFECALSNTLKLVSYWDNRSIKPIKNKSKKIPNVYRTFIRHLQKMYLGNNNFWLLLQQSNTINTPIQCVLGDARNLPIENEKIDLVVTSPPYVTSYEYADIHQLSALFFSQIADIKDFRKNFIGSSYNKNKQNVHLFSNIANEIIVELMKNNPQKAYSVKQYFADMYECFKELSRVIRLGGKCCIVVGNTNISGVEIKNAQVFVQQMQTLGFALDNVILREIPGKTLPQTRDKITGRFVKSSSASYMAYPTEYILIFSKK